jgi:hypothetical protein
VDRKTRISECERYRYTLWRDWGGLNRRYAVFVGLNPSTADASNDDPTIRRCVGFAKRWGYGALCMVNLFAYRTKEPSLMKAQVDPIGVENDRWLYEAAQGADVIVAAWGTHGTYRDRDRDVKRLLAGKLSCLGQTKDGHPRHPLYVKADVELISFA